MEYGDAWSPESRRLLRRRRRASHLPALGKAFHIPDEAAPEGLGPGFGIPVQAGEPLQLEPAVLDG